MAPGDKDLELPAPSPARPVTVLEAWVRENEAAVEEWNEYVERCGVPLGAFRLF
jgi:hypothetical protein